MHFCSSRALFAMLIPIYANRWSVYKDETVREKILMVIDCSLLTCRRVEDLDMNANYCCCPPLQSPCAEDVDIDLDCLIY